MTGPQFKKAIAALNLTQAACATWLHLSLRAVHGYANGAPIPEPVAKLLRLCVRLDLSPDDGRAAKVRRLWSDPEYRKRRIAGMRRVWPVDPQDHFDKGFVAIHGITEATVKGAPRFDALVDKIQRIMGGNIVVTLTEFDRYA